MSCRFEDGADQRKRFVPAAIPRARLRNCNLFADIIEDRRAHPALITCVAQRQHSSEILFLGQFHSRAEAQSIAEQLLGGAPVLGPPPPWHNQQLCKIASQAHRRIALAEAKVEQTGTLLRGTHVLLRLSRESPRTVWWTSDSACRSKRRPFKLLICPANLPAA